MRSKSGHTRKMQRGGALTISMAPPQPKMAWKEAYLEMAMVVDVTSHRSATAPFQTVRRGWGTSHTRTRPHALPNPRSEVKQPLPVNTQSDPSLSRIPEIFKSGRSPTNCTSSRPRKLKQHPCVALRHSGGAILGSERKLRTSVSLKPGPRRTNRPSQPRPGQG